ncbi:unnamed protein product [Caenorhabditis sp. 36 PRJEB53466]|nr:unnamed protein product [Caenorhabditis sp. 36 PRJEB53466]
MEEIADIVAGNLTNPDTTMSDSLDIETPPEDDLWNSDPDVKVALVMTIGIGLVLLVKLISNQLRIWRNQRNGRTIDDGMEGLAPEQVEQRRINAQRRIDEVLRVETEHDCPICLAAAEFPVLTDCGHIFCCQCIIRYWQHSKAIVSPCDCAICRSTFHMLLPVRWPSAPQNDEVTDQIHENNMRIDDYNRRFSNDRPVLDYVRDIPVLVPYLVRNFFNNDIFTLVYQIRIAIVFFVVIAYFVLPVDMIPEGVYGIIGLLDDCIISVVLIGALFRWLRNHMADRGLAARF